MQKLTDDEIETKLRKIITEGKPKTVTINR